MARYVEAPDQYGTELAQLRTQWPENLRGVIRAEGVAEPQVARFAQEIIALWRGLSIDLLIGCDAAEVRDCYGAAARSITSRAAVAGPGA